MWSQVCTGRTADLNDYYHHWILPGSDDGWTQERKLSAEFLEAILLREPWRSTQTRKGVRITGAWFDEPVDLSGAELQHELWLYKCRFADTVSFDRIKTRSLLYLSSCVIQKNLSFTDASIGGRLYMVGSKFADVNLHEAKIAEFDLSTATVTGKLNMNGMVVSGELSMRNWAEFAKVVLNGAKIGRQLDLSKSTVTGKLNMDSVVVGSSLIMRGAKFAEVVLNGAKIGGVIDLGKATVTGKLNMSTMVVDSGLLMRDEAEFTEVVLSGAKIGSQVDLSTATVAGTLDMSGMVVGAELFMRNGAEFADVALNGARIGSQLSLAGATVTGTLAMDGIGVGADLFMRGARFEKDIELVYAKVEGNLDTSGTSFAGLLDLTGSHVGKELRLADAKHLPTWGEKGLILRDTQVDALRDEPDAWPKHLDLKGFTYERFGGLGVSFDVKGRAAKNWFIDWLNRDDPYSPQPYKQLAKVLTEMGHSEEASGVLDAGRERAQQRALKDGHKLSWLGQWLLKWTIGYGYRDFQALYGVVGLVGIGWMVLFLTGQRRVPAPEGEGIIKLGPIYSLDMLLPIIRLREVHYKIEIKGVARYYFYLQKVLGFVPRWTPQNRPYMDRSKPAIEEADGTGSSYVVSGVLFKSEPDGGARKGAVSGFL